MVTVDDTDLDLVADSICVYGDAPNASAIATAIRAALEGAGVELVPLAALTRPSR